MEELLGLNPVTVPADAPHVLGVGSIFFLANKNSYIWGCGVLDPLIEIPPLDMSRIFAVRGTRTRDYLTEQGLSLPDIPLGDPGILVSRLEAFSSSNTTSGNRYAAAIVPHWASYRAPIFDRYRNSSEVALVDMRDNTLRPLELIEQASCVISQSLHGLIFAEALGKPTAWISQRNDDKWLFKFHDWYTNVRNPPVAPFPARRLNDELFAEAVLREVTLDQRALLDAFPRAADLYGPAGSHRSFRECRASSPHFISWPALESLTGPGTCSSSVVREAMALMTAEYRRWAERPYTILAAPGWAPPEGMAEKLQSAADGSRDFDALWIIDAGVSNGRDRLEIVKDLDASASGKRVLGILMRSSTTRIDARVAFALV